MPLKLNLKPGEKIFIGGAVLQNAGGHCEFSVLNDAPILRERDILNEEEADTPCRKIYFCVQLMYMDPQNLVQYQRSYHALCSEVLKAAPTTADYIAHINGDLATGRYYPALKHARKLMEYEQELMNHVKQPARSLPID